MIDNLKRLMDENNETAAQLSKETGIAQNTISNWFKRNKQMSIENAILIADHYGISVAELYGKED